jgi:hypothetical protein
LITDFFGAVSRVEVNDASVPQEAHHGFAISPSNHLSESDDDDTSLITNTSQYPFPGEYVSNIAISAYSRDGAQSRWKKQLKAWSAFGIVGALVGYVLVLSR